MNSTVRRLAVLGALGTTLGVVAPVEIASAATTPVGPPRLAFPLPAFPLPAFPLPAFPVTGLPHFAPVPLSFVGPSVGQVAAVIGPTVLTTAPSNFSNTNIQVSAGSNLTGGQAGP
jgi:hypothetical protein